MSTKPFNKRARTVPTSTLGKLQPISKRAHVNNNQRGQHDDDDGDEDDDDDDDGNDAPISFDRPDVGQSVSKSGGDDDVIQVDFGLYDVAPSDDLTFRALIQREYAFANVMSVSHMIAQQIAVGTTIKGDGTSEPLGFITAIPIPQRHEHDADETNGGTTADVLSTIRQFTLSRCSTESDRAALSAVWADALSGVVPTALIIQSRLINVPAALVPPLHQALMDDITWAAEHDDSDTSRARWSQLRRFILIAPTYAVATTRLSASDGSAVKKAKRRNKTSVNSSSSTFFYRFEEEMYSAAADLSVRYARTDTPSSSSTNNTNENGEIRGGGCIIAIDREKLQRVIQQLTSVVNGP